MTEVTVRPARAGDHDAVAAFTADTWSDRDVGDYIPEVFPEWVETDGDDQRTVVATVDGTAAGVCQAVVLSAHEAWLQGMRVDPAHRGEGLGVAMVEALFSWCRRRGATVARNMVFSWNDAGLGQSRTVGFDPGVEARWAHPDPDDGAEPELTVSEDPDAAWSAWQRDPASDHLGGLGVDPGESWAFSEVTRRRLRMLADDERVVALVGDDGTRATTARVRTRERETDGGAETWAVYGHSAWTDTDAARDLFAAVAADAAALGVDNTRVLVPETPRHVSDVAVVRAGAADEPLFVLESDLTGPEAGFTQS